MTSVKRLANRLNMQLLGAVASLAALTALASASSLCSYWFHQPKMPDSVRFMRR